MADFTLAIRIRSDGTAQVVGDLNKLQRSAANVSGDIKKVGADSAKAGQAMESMGRQASSAGSAMDMLKTALVGLSLAAVTKQVMALHDGLVLFQRGLGAVSGSTAEAGKNMAFVTNLASRLGMNINDLRNTFLSFAGSVKGTSLEGEAMRKIMESMATTGKNLGLSGEAMSRAFVAVSQMAAKGVISMEELRGQLGEAMPGALQSMASAMNMSLPAFIKFVSQGQALATEVLPKWSAEMDKANQSTVNAAAGFKTFSEVLTALRNEFQLLFESATSGDLMAQSTGGDWRAILAGIINVLNAMNDMMATSRKLAEHQKTVEGQWEAATAKLRALKEEYNGLVTSYLTSTASLNTARSAIEDQQRAVDLLKQTMEEAKVSVEAFAGAQDWMAKATERANATLQFRQAIGIGGGASVDLLDQVTKTKHDSLRQYEAYIDELARLSGMEKNLILSILHFEGGMDWQTGKNKVSPAGAIGPMQVMPDLAYLKAIGAEIKNISDLEDPFKNLAAGVVVWQDKLKQANGDMADATRRYNGAGAEANKYRDNVMGLYQALNKASGMQGQLAATTTSVTESIREEEQSLVALKTQLASARSLDQVARIKDEVAARETLLAGLKNIAKAEISLAQAQTEATRKYYEVLSQDPRKDILSDLEKEQALKDYIIKQTANEVKSVQDAQRAYQQLQKAVQIDAAIDANVKSLKDEKEALEASKQGAKAKAEAQERLAKTFDTLLAQQGKYVKSLQKESIAAQDALLKSKDTAAYKEFVRARERAVVVGQKLIATYEREALAALDAKYAAEDALESLQMRQGWANSVLQGFDQLWSNMITGAENAMEALQKTLKSWLLAIANWLLKQTLIIPITATMFGVSQESLGGGLLKTLGGASSAAGGGGGGGIFSTLFSGSGISDAFGLGIEKLGDFLGSGILQDLGVNILNAALPNWVTGLTGMAGGFIGNQFGGYGGFGGSVGGLSGAMLGQAFIPVPVLGAAIGAALGGLGGGFLGGLFGNDQEITGGVGYYDFNRGMAGAAHPGTDPAVVDMMQKLGQTMKEMEQSLRSSSKEFADMWNFGASMWLDTDTAGRVDAAYNSYSRGLQQQSFQAAEDAARWFMEQMVEDVKKQGELHLPELANMMQGMNLEQFMTVIQNLGAIQDAADVMDVGLEAAYQTLTDLGQAGETLSQTWQRVATEFGAVNLAMEGFRMPLLAMSPAGLQAADALVQLLGGMDGFASATSYFYENFFTEAERQEIAVQRATDAVADFNNAMGLSGDAYIDTRGELRAFVQGLDLTTEAGQQAFAAAMQVAPSIIAVAEALGTLGTEAELLAGIIEELFGAERKVTSGGIIGAGGAEGSSVANWKGEPGSLLERYIRQSLAPSEDVRSQTQKFFEEFYTPAEREAAKQQIWQKQVDDFNASLGLTGDAAIDTKAELRAYIESLDLTTEAGQAAYAEAMKLVDALLGLEAAANNAASSAQGIANAIKEIFGIDLVPATTVVGGDGRLPEKIFAGLNPPTGSLLDKYIEQMLKPSDDLRGQTQRFFEEFYTPEERATAQRKTWQNQLDAFNASLGLTGDAAIDTREEFRAYIESLDLTTEAGQAAYAEAMKLVEALLGLTGAAGAAAEAAESARQALWEQFAGLRQEWQGIKNDFADILAPTDTRTSGQRVRAYGQEAKLLLEGIKDGWDAAELDQLRSTLGNLANAARDARAYLDQMVASIHGLVDSALESRRASRAQEFQSWVETLKPEQQQDIFKQQAASAYKRGLAATDLASLEAAIGSFAENAGRYIDSLTDPQQKAWAEINYERILQAAQEKADRLAEAQRQQLVTAAQGLKNLLTEAFKQGGQVLLDAANEHINAANLQAQAAQAANIAATNQQVASNTQMAAANQAQAAASQQSAAASIQLGAADAQIAAANTPIQVDVRVQVDTATA